MYLYLGLSGLSVEVKEGFLFAKINLWPLIRIHLSRPTTCEEIVRVRTPSHEGKKAKKLFLFED